MSNQERVAERRKHWGELIARQQQSGKTVKAFCEESLFLRIFGPAQLDLTIQDGFGQPVRSREWFPGSASRELRIHQRIRDGSITDVVYGPKSARLVEM